MKSKLSLFLFLFLYPLIFNTCKTVRTEAEKPVAILGAFADEIQMLENKLTDKQVIKTGGIPFSRGFLNGKYVILAYTGIGKVNAAMTTTLVITHFNPTGVIFTGIAGSVNPDLHPTDVVIAETCVQHDLNIIYNDSVVSYRVTNPVTGEENPVSYESNKQWLKYLKDHVGDIHLLPYEIEGQVYHPEVRFGIIATGDAFIASDRKKTELLKRFQADAVEMEGGAIAQICYQQNIPFIIIRSISDSADKNAQMDLEKFLSVAAENANRVVLELLKSSGDQ
jgi:adenosylhomocysteine nucleosidase